MKEDLQRVGVTEVDARDRVRWRQVKEEKEEGIFACTHTGNVPTPKRSGAWLQDGGSCESVTYKALIDNQGD